MGMKNVHPTAREVLEVIEAGGYETSDGQWVDLTASLRASEAGVRTFTPDEIDSLALDAQAGRTAADPGSTGHAATDPGSTGHAATDAVPTVEVTDETTQQACARLAPDSDTAALNFAAARNPGGGFLSGSRAQEEELCRCSTLFPTLLLQPDYYDANRAHPSTLYTDHVIHSPRVAFFRLGSSEPWLARPVEVGIVTAPAPNRGGIPSRDTERLRALAPTFERRWDRVLCVAAHTGHDALVLGAWGCGAFRNDPAIVAEAAQRALRTSAATPCFRRIVFAVPDHGAQGRRNHAAFRGALGS